MSWLSRLPGYKDIRDRLGALVVRRNVLFLGDGFTVADDVANERTAITLDFSTSGITTDDVIDASTMDAGTLTDALEELDDRTIGLEAEADLGDVLTSDGAGGYSWEVAGAGSVPLVGAATSGKVNQLSGAGTVLVDADGTTAGGAWAKISDSYIANNTISVGKLTAGTAHYVAKTNAAGTATELGQVVNASVATGANVAVNKLAPGTNGQALLTTGGAAAWGAIPADATKADKPTAGAYRLARINAGNTDLDYPGATLDATDLDLGAINIKTTGFVGVGASLHSTLGDLRFDVTSTTSLITWHAGSDLYAYIQCETNRKVTIGGSGGIVLANGAVCGSSLTVAGYLNAAGKHSFQSTGAWIGSQSLSLGGGVIVIGVANATTEPTTNPTGGAIWWAYTDSPFKVRSSAGHKSMVAPQGFSGGERRSDDFTVTATTGGATVDIPTPTDTSGSVLIHYHMRNASGSWVQGHVSIGYSNTSGTVTIEGITTLAPTNSGSPADTWNGTVPAASGTNIRLTWTTDTGTARVNGSWQLIAGALT